MKREEKILNALTEIHRVSQRPRMGFHDKLQRILLTLLNCMQAERGSIMLLKGSKTLEVAASTNPDLIGVKQRIEADSPSSWVVRNKKLLLVDTPDQKARFTNGFGHYRKDTFLLAPILAHTRVVGVLAMTEKIGDDHFSEKEQETLLCVLGSLISALENHRLAESLKKHKKTLKEKNAALERLEKIRTDLFNMLIHDLKGPISEVMANLDILYYTIDDPENLEFVKTAQNGCDTLFRMVSDLLDVARMEEGSLKLLYEHIRPEELIKEVLARLPSVAMAKNISLKSALQKDAADLMIIGDRGMLVRVLQNLLMNAVYYSPPDATVEIGFKQEDDRHLVFSVKDNGPGIPLHLQEMIFDKFMQAEQKRVDGRKYTTGLGLAFCKMAVEAHQGAICVKSDGSNGSTFQFTLPLEERAFAHEN